MTNEDKPNRVYLGSYTGGSDTTLIVPPQALTLAEAQLAAEHARQQAETETAKRQVLQGPRTHGKLRRLFGLGGD